MNCPSAVAGNGDTLSLQELWSSAAAFQSEPRWPPVPPRPATRPVLWLDWKITALPTPGPGGTDANVRGLQGGRESTSAPNYRIQTPSRVEDPASRLTVVFHSRFLHYSRVAVNFNPFPSSWVFKHSLLLQMVPGESVISDSCAYLQLRLLVRRWAMTLSLHLNSSF